MKRLRALLSAYACRPHMGSEPGVGWNTVRELANQHDLWIITRRDNQTFIEAELANHPMANLNFIYCDIPGEKFWKRGLQAVHFHYYFWQIAAYFVARRLHTEAKFDIVHHITYVRHSTPSFLSLLPVPFIWGPVGGGESAPRAFWSDFDGYGKLYELLRDLTRWIGEHDPFVSMTARSSALANATTEETAICLKKLGARNVQIQSQVGLSTEELSQLTQLKINPSIPFRFLSIGRLLHWKGFHLGLRAFAQAKLADKAEYWIIGDGREHDHLQKLAEELNIAHSVKLWGNLPREDVLQKLGDCHALVHPSLHESGGFVCSEAMAAGRPVLCLDLGGPAIQVTPPTGYKIAAQTPDQVIQDLSEAMVNLVENPKLLTSMGLAARQRALDSFSWSAKCHKHTQLYKEIVQAKELQSPKRMGV